MSHLSDIELVDLVDGTLSPERQRHVDHCDACRVQAESLRSTFASAKDAGMPEPSPLFWDHFSARVHEAVGEATPEEAGRWFSRPTLRWAMASALATVVLVAVVWRASAPTTRQLAAPGSPAVNAASTLSSNDSDIDSFDPDTDQAWALVRTVADEATWDSNDSEVLTVRPGTTEGALANLTHAERSELVRLIEAEIRM